MARFSVFAALAIVSASAAYAQTPTLPASAPLRPAWATGPAYEAPKLQTGTATLVREYAAPEAGQGVAVDANHFYAVVNFVLAKYDRETGTLVKRWVGLRGGLIRHINSCFADQGELLCANSNFPETPMASSIEIFDAATMTHKTSTSLGMQDEGSLTFFDRLKGGWIAGFAHYDADGGVPYKSSKFAGIVTYDAEWRRTGGWMMPSSVTERLAPHAASGGALGPDGLLYLLGHDRTEMYVLAKPIMGPVLIHLATIDIAAEGQAFAWDTAHPRRLFAISRKSRAVRVFDIPAIALPEGAGQRFER